MTDKLITVAEYMHKHSQEALSLAVLSSLVNWSSSHLQRQFKARFGVSPKQYQDMLRMGVLKKHLQERMGSLDAIYAAGFGSPSRVYGEVSRQLGMSPSVYARKGLNQQISYAFASTSFGLLCMAATDKGVCFVQFGDSERGILLVLENEFKEAEITPSNSLNTPELDAWLEALEHYLEGNAPKPDLPLDMRGTAFQLQVWQFLLQLKPKQTVTYTDVANAIGRPKSVRGVANACGQNNIGVLVPCHKVLRSDGSLGGYRWGIERKQSLLDWER